MFPKWQEGCQVCQPLHQVRGPSPPEVLLGLPRAISPKAYIDQTRPWTIPSGRGPIICALRYYYYYYYLYYIIYFVIIYIYIYLY